MTAPTGNQWRDPDTKQIANPGNLQADLTGIPIKDKFGKAILGEESSPSSDSTPASSSAIGAVREGEDLTPQEGDEIPEVVNQMGRAVHEERTIESELLETDKLRIRTFGREIKSKDAGKRALAETALATEARREYGRPDGGRAQIKKILHGYGFGDPAGPAKE